MEKLKKVWKELSVFGVVLVCILGLYVYRLLVTVDITTISSDKVVEKIEDGDDFVIYTGSLESANTRAYQSTVETYLKKNRSSTIYFLDLDDVEDAENFVKTNFDESGVDTNNPHTYVFVDGKLTTSHDGVLGYYTLDKAMTKFNETK